MFTTPDLTRHKLACAKCGDTAVYDLLSFPVDPANGNRLSVEVVCPNTECGALAGLEARGATWVPYGLVAAPD